jgi:hypothetical protein
MFDRFVCKKSVASLVIFLFSVLFSYAAYTPVAYDWNVYEVDGMYYTGVFDAEDGIHKYGVFVIPNSESLDLAISVVYPWYGGIQLPGQGQFGIPDGYYDYAVYTTINSDQVSTEFLDLFNQCSSDTTIIGNNDLQQSLTFNQDSGDGTPNYQSESWAPTIPEPATSLFIFAGIGFIARRSRSVR